jgi:hypothetical protein
VAARVVTLPQAAEVEMALAARSNRVRTEEWLSSVLIDKIIYIHATLTTRSDPVATAVAKSIVLVAQLPETIGNLERSTPPKRVFHRDIASLLYTLSGTAPLRASVIERMAHSAPCLSSSVPL